MAVILLIPVNKNPEGDAVDLVLSCLGFDIGSSASFSFTPYDS